jgi:sulfate/thiosulfate transport system permease protein
MTSTHLDPPAAPLESPVLPRLGRAPSGLPRLGLRPGIGLGVGVAWLTLLVLLPLAVLVATGFGTGVGAFVTAITNPNAVEAIGLTVVAALIVTVINVVVGTLIAWVLVRDEFPGKRIVETIIDVPFALPTVVAGVVLLSIYGTSSPVGISLQGTRSAIVLALLFVTLPFVVRAVEPVLLALDTDAEQAAACLGASRFTIFRRIVLPLLLPAIASGAGLAFARAMGEYGSVLLISGGLNSTRVASMYAFQLIQNSDYQGAASIATVLLAVSLVVLLALDIVQRRVAKRG